MVKSKYVHVNGRNCGNGVDTWGMNALDLKCLLRIFHPSTPEDPQPDSMVRLTKNLCLFPSCSFEDPHHRCVLVRFFVQLN